jgi:hypothetical protein
VEGISALKKAEYYSSPTIKTDILGSRDETNFKEILEPIYINHILESVKELPLNPPILGDFEKS